MSMTASFLSVSPQQLQQITADPDEIEPLLGKRFGSRFPSKKRSDYCDIDKSWQTIHFLLSQGDPWEVTNTESLAVLGGTEFGPDMGYGPARFLTADEVKQVAAALSPIDTEELNKRFDGDKMAGADLYSFSKQHPGDELEFAQSYFTDLRNFYAFAAEEGKAVLLFIL